MAAEGRTHRGLVRRANEDVFAIGEGVLVVVDGMGGHVAGKLAAALAVTELVREGEPVERFVAANAAVFGRTLEHPDLAGMGCVAARVAIDGSRATIAHVGDCRVFAAQAGGACMLLTRDHTVRERSLERFCVSESEAHRAPGRNEVTRDLGADSELAADVVDLAELDVEPGDLLLLCSDGLSDHVLNSEIYAELRTARELGQDLAELADRFIGLALDRGGRDNVTVLVARVGPVEDKA